LPVKGAVPEGLPLWDPGISSRKLFFFANWYFGADAVYEAGEYAMYSDVLDASLTSRSLSFNLNSLSHARAETIALHRQISDMYDLQEAWVDRFLCRSSVPPSNRQ